MALKTKKKHLLSNAPLKAFSLILGYTFWYIFSNAYPITIWKTIPLCFYFIPAQHKITGPDTVSVQLTGKRSHLHALDRQNFAVHINAQNLQKGKHLITITPDTLFLPDSIKLVHYIPSNVQVTIEESHNTA